MEKSYLDYVASNGEYCIAFLEELRNGTEDLKLYNRIFNHALAVRALVVELRKLFSLYNELQGKYDRLSADHRKLTNGIYEEFVAAEVEKIKNSLVDHIMEF